MYNDGLRNSQDHAETKRKATNVDDIVVRRKIAEYVRFEVGTKAEVSNNGERYRDGPAHCGGNDGGRSPPSRSLVSLTEKVVECDVWASKGESKYAEGAKDVRADSGDGYIVWVRNILRCADQENDNDDGYTEDGNDRPSCQSANGSWQV